MVIWMALPDDMRWHSGPQIQGGRNGMPHNLPCNMIHFWLSGNDLPTGWRFGELRHVGGTSALHATRGSTHCPLQHRFGPAGVTEAHLRFTRMADGVSNMPHLRKFARPVDWNWLSQDTWNQQPGQREGEERHSWVPLCQQEISSRSE